MRRRGAELAVLAALALAAAGGWLAYEAITAAPGGPVYTAAFTNARGLLAGNDVREDGAIVGRVTATTVAHDGTARVAFTLSDARAAPRTGASAAIEAEDLLGDNYLALSPGTGGALRGAIPVTRTVDAPRLDEVLDTFTPNVRDGLRTALVESGLALDQRGGDLAATAVALRPALDTAAGVLRELDSQNGSLARLVPVAARVSAQLDRHRGAIPVALAGLQRTLAAAAAAATPLGQTVSGLPATLARVTGTAHALSRLSVSGAAVTRRLAPQLTTLAAAARALPAFTRRVGGAAPALTGVLNAATDALTRGTAGFTALAHALPTLRGQAPVLDSFLGELDAAAPGIAQGFFTDFADQAAESGRQPFDPFADPRRAYWRGAAVFSCEAFGVPVKPGCLSEAIANLARQPPPSTTQAASAESLLNFLLKP